MTWSRRMRDGMVFEKLDRCLVTESWFHLFTFSFIRVLIKPGSDHLPLLVHVLNKPHKEIRNCKQFRFEHMWVAHEESSAVIEESWNRDEEANVQQCIVNCGQALENWDVTVFGNVRYGIQRKKKELEQAYITAQVTGVSRQLHDCLDEFNDLYDREEIMWRQRSKVSWLREGDRNSRFFHSVVNTRKAKNNIASIQDDGGNWHSEIKTVEKVVVDYFKQIFITSNPLHSDIEHVLGTVDQRVTAEMNAKLNRPFTVEDIRVAAFDMGADKSPGPDGMTPLFYQQYWHIVGEKASEMALAFLNLRQALPDINHTSVVLIPKNEHPCMVKDYRPISLCNVVFKIVSKALANRLGEILPEVIGPNQSAFVPGRMIFDSSFIVFETIHYMKNKRAGGANHMALKLDLSKAYDRVEWAFLEGMMLRLGFSQQWTSLVMSCVTTVSYSIMVNGTNTEKFSPSRGIRQGDPLSPYLFLFCMEGLSCLLQRAELDGHIRGVAINRYAPTISHLFFVDDSILFLRASLRECDVVLDLLRQFSLASGQQVNVDKSAILFSSNTPVCLRESIMQHLGVQKILDRDRYLGIPIMIDKSKKAELQLIKDRLWKRLQRWKGSLLSIAGTDTLIWNSTVNGSYTVRSGYYVARSLLGHDDIHVDDRSPVWRLIWSAHVLPKVKYFFWRVIQDILPTKPQLQRRGVPIDLNCVVCGGNESSLYHVFFECTFSRQVWVIACPWLPVYLESYEYGASFRRDRQSQTIVRQQWTPPTQGRVKINTDAAFSQHRQEAALGVVFRDTDGHVLLSGITRITNVPNSLFAEMYTIRFGLLLALSYSFVTCEVESDSLLANIELNRQTPSLWEGGSLILQIKHIVSSFDFCSFKHVSRVANTLAHNLAHLDCDVGANYV
ncbi:reverse transcriptase [Corchorus capsularis]|uniref:Reverse transcriptase n=1 Tax=Corchorus capsularis TaxID=210143 RepID=A0A1R3IUT4_COCAP|nr:reverse transcriptase [Corchorus capsularis]